jgi:hypothetical protein
MKATYQNIMHKIITPLPVALELTYPHKLKLASSVKNVSFGSISLSCK